MDSGGRVAAPSGPYAWIKRATDLALSILGLCVLWPVLAVSWLAVRIESPGPGVFRQRRIGRWGREFTIYKLRTMRTDAPNLATHEMDAGESYITRVGAVLRRFSIDELPQLVNVITGDMSLVGPRPALYSQTDLTAMRHAIGVDRLRPGVTGLAQVMGRDDLLLAEKVAYDAEYLERADAVTDLSVLARTVGAVLSQRGVR